MDHKRDRKNGAGIRKMSNGKPPVFTSDKIDQLEGALLRFYGRRERPEY